MSEPTRAEHLTWCKQRAMEYVELGNNAQALMSIGSDLAKHDKTRRSSGPVTEHGTRLLLAGLLETKEQMTEWIQGIL